MLHPHSHHHLPNLYANEPQNWEQSDPPPVTLKNLSQNLTFLEKQYHIKEVSKSTPKSRGKVQFSSVPVRKTHHKQNSQFPHIFSSKEAVDLSARMKKRSSSLVKDMGFELDRENEPPSAETKRGGIQFNELRGLFPLEGKQSKIFLHKHKMMNILRIVNLNRIRTRATSKQQNYTVLFNQQKQNQRALMSGQYTSQNQFP